MKRPLWFRRRGLHWMPCAWQGWLAIGMFVLLLTLAGFRWASPNPISFVAASIALAALLLGVAVLTDDRQEESTQEENTQEENRR